MDSASTSEILALDGGEERLLATANGLLETTGIGNQPIVSFEELQLVATDLFVALFEVMFFAELAEIQRKPETFEDSVHNATTVLDILGQVLGSTMDLPDCVTGTAVAAGDTAAIAYLLRVFVELGKVTTQHQRQQLLRSAQASSAEGGGSVAGPPPRVVHRYDVHSSATSSPQRPTAAPAAPRPKKASKKASKQSSSRASRGPSSTRKGGKKTRASPTQPKKMKPRSAPGSGSKRTANTSPRGAATAGYPDLASSPPGAFHGVAESRTVPSPPEGHLDGRRHEGQATSGEGLGPNGRPGTAVGGARSRLRHFAPRPVESEGQHEHGGMAWPTAEHGTRPAPSPIVDIWADAAGQAGAAAPPQPARGAAVAARAPVAPPPVPRSNKRAATASGSTRKPAANGGVKVRGALSGHSRGVDMMATRGGGGNSKRRGGTKGAKAAPARPSTAPASKKPSRRKVQNPTGAATLAGQRAAALKRSARAAQAAKRREEAELAQLKQRLSAAHNAAIKDRVANWRVRESRFLKRAAKRTAAAAHTQRVMTIRTTRVLEDAQRATLALRLRRASEQARITAEYTAAIAAQEREAALEAAKAAAADARAEEAALAAKREAALHQLGITQALMKEASAVQAADLRVAAAGQAAALRESTRDILAAGRAVEVAAAQARESKDAQWAVQQFGDMSARETRPLGAVPPAVLQAQKRWLAAGGGADVQLLGDGELAQPSVSSMGGASAQEDSFLAHVGKQMQGHEADTQAAGGFDFDEDWVVHGGQTAPSGGVSAESSGYLGYPAYKANEVPPTTTSRHGMIVTRANAGLTPGDEPRLLNVRGSTFARTSTGGGGGGYNGSRTEWA